MLEIFKANFYYDFLSLLRKPTHSLNSSLFFLMLISLFGIGLSHISVELTKQLVPCIIWINCLLTLLFTIESSWREEYSSGVMEQWLVSVQPLWWLVLSKALSLCVISCTSLLLCIPLLGIKLSLSYSEQLLIGLSFILGTPALTLMGLIGSSLTLGLARSGIFLGLLMFPLYIPILILGLSCIETIINHQIPVFQLNLLVGLSLLTITLAPIAISAALRGVME